MLKKAILGIMIFFLIGIIIFYYTTKEPTDHNDVVLDSENMIVDTSLHNEDDVIPVDEEVPVTLIEDNQLNEVLLSKELQYYSIFSIPLDQGLFNETIEKFLPEIDDSTVYDVDDNLIQIEVSHFDNTYNAVNRLLELEMQYPNLVGKLFVLRDDIAEDFEVEAYRSSNEYIGYIDQNDSLLIWAAFINIDWFSSGIAIIDTLEQNSLLLKTDGRFVITNNFSYIKEFNDGIGVVLVDGSWTYYNEENIFLVTNDYTDTWGGTNVKQHDGKWGFIDTEGNIIIEPIYMGARGFSEGLAPVDFSGPEEDAKWGFIDTAGNVIIEPDYKNAYGFSEGLASVDFSGPNEYGRWGFIDIEGKIILEPIYEHAYGFNNGVAAVSMNGPWGFIDKNGTVIVTPKFAHIDPFENDLAMAYGISTKYMINSRGEIIESYNDTYIRGGTVIPSDDISENITSFMNEYLDKLEKKDLDYVLDHLDVSVSNSYDSNGTEDFIAMWQLDKDYKNSDFWEVMTKIINMGVYQYGDEYFVVPYLWEKFPEEYDTFDYGYIINDNVPVYSETDFNSKVLSLYSNEVILMMHFMVYEDSDNTKWNTVIINDGQIGFIESHHLHRVLNYRAHFAYDKKSGTWLLNSLKAGD